MPKVGTGGAPRRGVRLARYVFMILGRLGRADGSQRGHA
jgi:hypothetical protein